MSVKNRIASLDDIFSPGGVLEKQLPNYEFRPSQLNMAKAVLDAMEGERHLCVEAGTGTGKTLAYLIPALRSRKRVIVSTATRNLQEQLFFKDIPFIKKYLFPQLAVTYMKGRNNYLCLKKYYEHNPQDVIFGGAVEEWKHLSGWVRATETGDRAELRWMRDDDPLWRHLDARGETCVGQKCQHFDECFITKMRQRALESDLIVVNHALLFSNLALQTDEVGKTLPEFAVLILDEAHEVEDVACAHFGHQISSFQIEDLCRDLQPILKQLPEHLGRVIDLEKRAEEFFNAFPAEEGHFSLNFFRRNGGQVDLRLELAALYTPLFKTIQVLHSQLQRENQKTAEVDSVVRRLGQLRQDLQEVFSETNPDHVYWFEKRGRGVVLHLSPIDVAPILKDVLFQKIESVILTSATLTTGGNFDYIRSRLGVPSPVEMTVPSEFDFSTQAILYVPHSFPEPRSPEYFLRALRDIRAILDVTEGHAFLLFTSYQQMNRVYRSLEDNPRYPLFKQGEMPKNELLEVFRSTPHAVLCATASFWQGVDVQGDALRAVIIDKLPFQVPSEPVVAARLNRLEQGGDNSFLNYSVPEAIISLKQGLGRLIRSRKDRGILAIFDSRLRTRSYGRLFLESLPNCPLTDNIVTLRNFFQSSGSV